MPYGIFRGSLGSIFPCSFMYLQWDCVGKFTCCSSAFLKRNAHLKKKQMIIKYCTKSFLAQTRGDEQEGFLELQTQGGEKPVWENHTDWENNAEAAEFIPSNIYKSFHNI